jgi:ferrous iron transport protein B
MRRIALVGNPNVGKSSLFNALTGLHQHTGNWPGKTVAVAQGHYTYKGKDYQIVDLPGTYSLTGLSAEEGITADFLETEVFCCTVAVCDATCLEKSLMLALQILERCPNPVICVNLMDEARRLGTEPNLPRLSALLGVPVVGASAQRGEGLRELQETVRQVCEGFAPLSPHVCQGGETRYAEEARHIAAQVGGQVRRSSPFDRILLHPVWGYPVLMLLLLLIFWLTIEGANYPSRLLQWGFDRLGLWLRAVLPASVTGPLLDGIYTTTARVISVMLPPMSVFFPLFTLLEDSGYLARVAFLLDEGFRRVGACGKQALTLCMGFGCNCAGVTGCRIIESPRERSMAVLTNALVPCNGRFPALICLLSAMFSTTMGRMLGLAACVLLAVAMTLLSCLLLHRTRLKGEPSSFVLELPPYRRPNLRQVLLRSLLDRSLKILRRAVAVAAPAGLLLWLLEQGTVQGQPLLLWLAGRLDGFASLFGLKGAVLLAFVLGSPANELVLPLAEQIGGPAVWEGTALCTLLFMLFHWPCTTTLWTIRKETGSRSMTLWALLLPTILGASLCFLWNLLF